MNLVVTVLVAVLLTILSYVVVDRVTEDTDLAFLVAVVVLFLSVIVSASPGFLRGRGR